MTIEEAIRILGPETRRETLREIPVFERIDVDQEACRIAVVALRAQQQPNDPPAGWISVEDKLPEAGGYVACIAKRNPFSRFMPMVARIEKNGWANPITEQYISEVTHWMPLPEPPEEGTV